MAASGATRIPGFPPSHADRIRDHLITTGVDVQSYAIDVATVRHYMETTPYPAHYRDGFGIFFPEKALEHWLSLVLLGDDLGDSMDVASDSSPFADIAQVRTGRPMYRQDLTYPPGISGRTIGGSADALPLPDGSLDTMTLHCAFEHFEGEADTGLIREAARVLRPGGRLCILPLYLADTFANITDPVRDEPAWDRDAMRYDAGGWGNRFGRWYDVARLHERVLAPAASAFAPTVYYVIKRDGSRPRVLSAVRAGVGATVNW